MVGMHALSGALSGVSWHLVVVCGVIVGCVLAFVDRIRKRPEMQWMDVALNGMLFSAILVFPWFGEYKDVLLALSLGWVIESVMGLLWGRLARATAGREQQAQVRG
jgi:hypothetical protein